MTQYKENMKDFDNILSLEKSQVRAQTTDLMFQISTIQNSIRKQHAMFKKNISDMECYRNHIYDYTSIHLCIKNSNSQSINN